MQQDKEQTHCRNWKIHRTQGTTTNDRKLSKIISCRLREYPNKSDWVRKREKGEKNLARRATLRGEAPH